MTPPTFLSPTASYFDIFGVGAAVDDTELTRRFRELTRLYHPDRFATADAEIQADALTSTALVNDGYRTLRDPFARAEYLLRTTRGRPQGRGAATPPQALFARVLEVQELLLELQEADADGDRAAVERLGSELRALQADFQSAHDTLLHQLADAFLRYDAGQTEAALDALRTVVDERGYLRRVLENIAAAVQ